MLSHDATFALVGIAVVSITLLAFRDIWRVRYTVRTPDGRVWWIRSRERALQQALQLAGDCCEDSPITVIDRWRPNNFVTFLWNERLTYVYASGYFESEGIELQARLNRAQNRSVSLQEVVDHSKGSM